MTASAPCPWHRCWPNRKERSSLRIGDAACDRHLDIVVVDLLESLAFRQQYLCRDNAPIEPGFHHCAGAENADRFSSFDRSIDLGDNVEDRQRRYRVEFAYAEVSGHRGDCGGARTRCCQSLN